MDVSPLVIAVLSEAMEDCNLGFDDVIEEAIGTLRDADGGGGGHCQREDDEEDGISKVMPTAISVIWLLTRISPNSFRNRCQSQVVSWS